MLDLVHGKQPRPVDNLIMEHKQDLGHKEPHRAAPVEVETTAEEGVSFFHDFVAGGVAGSASVVVGHPFDTLKVN
jgi:Mitochondrial carrier protein